MSWLQELRERHCQGITQVQSEIIFVTALPLPFHPASFYLPQTSIPRRHLNKLSAWCVFPREPKTLYVDLVTVVNLAHAHFPSSNPLNIVMS